MSNLKSRVDKLYSASISTVTSKITVLKNDDIIKESKIGNNKKKVIQIVIRF